MKSIPYNKQFIDIRDKKYLIKSLNQDLITTGPMVKNFEDEIRNLTKSKFAVSCSSGTAAIHLAMLSLNLKKGDVVIMPAINFISSYNISRMLGLKIFLADVDPLSGQMTPETLLECINKNKIKRINLVITMYMGGYPEYIYDFYKLKKKFNFYILEDACHAFGAKYTLKNRLYRIGGCYHSDICTFSFHPVKTVTTGEGGAVTTKNKSIYDKLILFRNHGIKRDKKKYWKYDVLYNSLNYRISDLNCALGVSQIKKLNQILLKRKKIFNFYYKELNDFKDIIKIYDYKNLYYSAYHLFLVSINYKKLKTKKENLIKYLIKKKIFTQYHYIPIYKFSVFSKKNFKLKNSEYYFNNSLSLPIFYELNINVQKKIIREIKFFLKKHLEKLNS